MQYFRLTESEVVLLFSDLNTELNTSGSTWTVTNAERTDLFLSQSNLKCTLMFIRCWIMVPSFHGNKRQYCNNKQRWKLRWEVTTTYLIGTWKLKYSCWCRETRTSIKTKKLTLIHFDITHQLALKTDETRKKYLE